jgi:hypothetical protein
MRAKTLVLVALAFVSACHGDIVGPVDTSHGTPKETLTVTLNGPADGSVIKGTTSAVTAGAQVISNRGSVSGSNVSWKLNDSDLSTTGMSISLSAAAGTNKLCVHVQGVDDATADKCVEFIYSPVIACKVVRDYPASPTLTGSPLRITFTKNGKSATRLVGADGDCGLESEIMSLTNADTIKFVLDVDSGTRTHNAMLGYASKADLDKGLVIIQMSKVYPVQSSEVNVDLALCYVAGSDGQSFCPRHIVSGTNRYWYNSTFYQSSALPVPAIISDQPVAISAEAKSNLWSYVARINQLLGFTFIKQAGSGDAVDGVKGFVFKSDPNQPTLGAANATTAVVWNGTDYTGGTTIFLGEDKIISRTSEHEIVHLLGNEHGCGFPSIMAVACGPNGFQEAPEPTSYDIAYTLQRIRVRELERQYGTKFSYCENHQGLRVVERGQAEEFCFKDHP